METDANLDILMVAAENGALPGGKVGGIGDVVRDVAPALARLGCRVNVLTPAYGFLMDGLAHSRLGRMEVGFGGAALHLDLYEVEPPGNGGGVRHLVLDHPQFDTGGTIYCNDPPDAPFATDAGKFALFCAATAEGIEQGLFGAPDVVHLHDWHAALFLALRKHHPAYSTLQTLPCVYTIHNLALQGVRPLRGHASSLQAWFPGLANNPTDLTDPRWPNCINPMAIGIRLADRVHTVSRSYAEEILQPSEVSGRGYYGGEGLEAELRAAAADNRLLGILNGCEYAAERPPGAHSRQAIGKMIREELLRWAGQAPNLASAHFIALSRLDSGARFDDDNLLVTSVSRVTEQKVRLLREKTPDGRNALQSVLEAFPADGLYVFLGTGDSEYETFLTTMAARHANFLFLRGFSEPLANALYECGDLFLMPSSFEPCGISQMLAMRAGQPCIVHGVGGLKDTVLDEQTGFVFTGDSLAGQAQGLVETFKRALTVRDEEPKRWRAIRQSAAQQRFTWDASVGEYLDKLYRT